MPVLDRLNERWVADFERKLEELIRQPLDVTLQEVQLAPYGNWLAALPVPTSFSLFTVKPWPRNALVAVDGKLLFALVNAYYGGTRITAKTARETLTPTEQRLNRIVIDMLVDLFRRALSPVCWNSEACRKLAIRPMPTFLFLLARSASASAIRFWTSRTFPAASSSATW